jgi:AcrR family transcriptional regulator
MTVTRRSFTIGPDTLRKRQKEATRERILHCARQLFSEHGYEATTMQTIARAAKVSSGNVFVHFDSKADVLATLMHEDIVALDQLIAKRLPRRGTVRSRLLKMFELFLDHVLPTERLIRTLVAYSWNWDENWEALFEGSTAIRKHQIRGILEAGIQSGEIRPDADLDAFGVCVFGIAEQLFKVARFHGYDKKLFLGQVDRSLQVLLNGVGTGRP